MQGLFSEVNLIDVHHELLRNIVSLRVSEDLFDDLTDDHEAWAVAQQLESDTKPSLLTNDAPIIRRPFEEAEWNMAIAFPFQHSAQSRFSDGSYGVWYGGGDLETTVHETVYHWRNKLLSDAEGFLKPGVCIERRIYQVRCDAALINFKPVVKKYPDLIHPNDYNSSQAVGRKMHREGHPGLLTQSARCPGDVYAIFTPNVLSNPSHVCFMNYVTTSDGVEVQKELGKKWTVSS